MNVPNTPPKRQANTKRHWQKRPKNCSLSRRIADAGNSNRRKTAQRQTLKEALALATKDVEKYSKSSKELMEELRSQYVEVMQEQANTANDLKYLERQYQQETAKNQQSLAKHEALEEQMVEALAMKETLEKEQKVAKQGLQEQLEEYTALKATLEAKRERLAQRQNDMYQAMNQVQQAKARQKVCKKFKKITLASIKA